MTPLTNTDIGELQPERVGGTMPGSRTRPASAVMWNGVGIGGRHLLQFATTIVIARILSPQDFGAVGMIVVLTAFAGVCADLGLSVALVQHTNLQSRQLDAAFWITAGAGVLVTIVVWLLAPSIAAFYDQPVLSPLARVAAFQFALNGIGVVPRALLVRAVRFRALATVELCTGIAAAACSVAFALAGAGVWTLIAQILAAAAVGAGLSAVFARWRPRSFAGPRELTDLAAFSRNLLAFRTVNYWARNADDLLIGKFLGASPLGLYTLAYQLIMLPLQQITVIIGDVMLPVMASCRSDLAHVRLAFVRAVQAIALALFPAMIGLVIVAGEAVPTLFGEGWLNAVPVVRVLAVAGCFQALGVTVGWIYQSQGRTDIMFRWGAFAALITVIGIAAGLRWGIPGVAAGYTAAVVVLTPLSHVIAGRLIGLRARELVTGVAPAIVATSCMAVVAFAARALLLEAGNGPGLVLAGTIASGGAAYVLALRALRPASLEAIGPFIYWPRGAHASASTRTWRIP